MGPGPCIAKRKSREGDYRGFSYDGAEAGENLGLGQLKDKHSTSRGKRKSGGKELKKVTSQLSSKLTNRNSPRAQANNEADHDNTRLTLDMRRKSTLKPTTSMLRSRNSIPEGNQSQIRSRFTPPQIRNGSSIRRPSTIAGDGAEQQESKRTPVGRETRSRLNTPLETIPSEGSKTSGQRSVEPVLHVTAPQSPTRSVVPQYTTSRIERSETQLRRIQSVPNSMPTVIRPTPAMPLQPPPHLSNSPGPAGSQMASTMQSSIRPHSSMLNSNGLPPNMETPLNGGMYIMPPAPVPPQISMTAELVQRLKLDCGEEEETKEMRRFDYDRRMQF